jgi:hypothetical protein
MCVCVPIGDLALKVGGRVCVCVCARVCLSRFFSTTRAAQAVYSRGGGLAQTPTHPYKRVCVIDFYFLFFIFYFLFFIFMYDLANARLFLTHKVGDLGLVGRVILGI